MRSGLLFGIILFCFFTSLATDSSWSKIRENKGGLVTFYWSPNNIIIKESKDIIDGVEHDLAYAFIDFLNKKYELEIKIDWVETNGFTELISIVEESEGGVFGASSISITEKRRETLNFTPPYLTDIAVIVSNTDIPVAETLGEFKEVFRNRVAVSIENTTLLDALYQLKEKSDINFELSLVKNSGQIIETISKMKNAFGYIDLPNFLISINKNTLVRRQFFYPIKLEGLAMVYPKDSDWDQPVAEYFESDQFSIDVERSISKYFGKDVAKIIDRISKSAEMGPLEEIVLSNREKQLQYKELLKKSERERQNIRNNNLLSISLAVGLIMLIFLSLLYRIKSKSNHQLTEKNNVILHSLREKEDLIKEIHHRVKNNLQVVSSMLNIQSKYLKDEEAMGVVSDMQNRVISMSLVHENLHKTKSISHVFTDEYLKSVSNSVFKMLHDHDKPVTFHSCLDRVRISSNQAIKLGLVINEILTNAFKHAFPEDYSGEAIINMTLKEVKGNIKLEVIDNGVGFSKMENRGSYGIRLIKSMTKSMKGNITIQHDKETKIKIEVPIDNE